jgi:hypothetical protein
MTNDLLEHIHAIDPVPEDVQAPPLEQLLPDRDRRPAGELGFGRHGRALLLRRRNLLALPIAGAILALALLGAQGRRQFDVAAAVYKATLVGGVHYMFLEGESGHIRIIEQRWTASDPLREREIIGKRGQTVELVSGGGFETAWSNSRPRKILRVRGSAPVSNWDPVRVIQQAYRAGRLRVLGKTTLEGHAAYRAEVVSADGRASGPIVIVDAHTYMPLEMLYGNTSHGSPLLVVHVRSYEELPATNANVALLKIAHHAGAHDVTVKREQPR